MPSFKSSPWILGAPQSELASAILRINKRTSDGMVGRPRRRRLFQVQKSRKPRRCHARTVLGLTMTTAARHSFQRFDSQTHNIRSACVSRSRGRDRFTTWSWCRNARISSCRPARSRSDARRVKSNETMTDRIDRNAIRGNQQDQSLQEEPNYWQAHPVRKARSEGESRSVTGVLRTYT